MSLKNLRTRFNRFCLRNRDKGIPNLMLYISIGCAIVYVYSLITRSSLLYGLLSFDRGAILQGQVWRLITYPLTYGAGNGNPLLIAISLLCYYSLGRTIEHQWGTFRFNLFYLSGVLLMDVYCLVFPCYYPASANYLNLSLFIAYATLYPDAQFLLFFIIPVKAWIFALVDLGITLLNVVQMSFPVFFFPDNLFPLVALANYFLFFGRDVVNILPPSWRRKAQRNSRNRPVRGPSGPKVIPFASQGNQSAAKAPYNHRCTVCGRTDVTNPELEFRYCSRCSGYYCYCQDHIGNHAHIQ